MTGAGAAGCERKVGTTGDLRPGTKLSIKVQPRAPWLDESGRGGGEIGARRKEWRGEGKSRRKEKGEEGRAERKTRRERMKREGRGGKRGIGEEWKEEENSKKGSCYISNPHQLSLIRH